MALQRIHNVGGGQRGAIVEAHVAAQLYVPNGRTLARRQLLGKVELRGQTLVERGEPVVEYLLAIPGIVA